MSTLIKLGAPSAPVFTPDPAPGASGGGGPSGETPRFPDDYVAVGEDKAGSGGCRVYFAVKRPAPPRTMPLSLVPTHRVWVCPQGVKVDLMPPKALGSTPGPGGGSGGGSGGSGGSSKACPSGQTRMYTDTRPGSGQPPQYGDQVRLYACVPGAEVGARLKMGWKRA